MGDFAVRRSSTWMNTARTITWAAAGALLLKIGPITAAEPAIVQATRVIACGDAESAPAVVTGVSITPDARTVAAATDDHRVLVWNSADGELVARLEGHADWVRSLCLAPDGKTLASGGGDRSVCVWDLEDGRQVFRTIACDKAIAGLCFHPNNQQIAVVGFCNRLQIINTSAGQTSQELRCPCGDVRTVTFSPDGTRLAVVATSQASSAPITGTRPP